MSMEMHKKLMEGFHGLQGMREGALGTGQSERGPKFTEVFMYMQVFMYILKCSCLKRGWWKRESGEVRRRREGRTGERKAGK